MGGIHVVFAIEAFIRFDLYTLVGDVYTLPFEAAGRVLVKVGETPIAKRIAPLFGRLHSRVYELGSEDHTVDNSSKDGQRLSAKVSVRPLMK